MGKITVEVKINTFGTILYSLNHPIVSSFPTTSTEDVRTMKVKSVIKYT